MQNNLEKTVGIKEIIENDLIQEEQGGITQIEKFPQDFKSNNEIILDEARIDSINKDDIVGTPTQVIEKEKIINQEEGAYNIFHKIKSMSPDPYKGATDLSLARVKFQEEELEQAA